MVGPGVGKRAPHGFQCLHWSLLKARWIDLIAMYALFPQIQRGYYDPPRFSIFRHGRRSCAATCQITRGGGAIIDICTVVFGSIALVSLHARGSSL